MKLLAHLWKNPRKVHGRGGRLVSTCLSSGEHGGPRKNPNPCQSAESPQQHVCARPGAVYAQICQKGPICAYRDFEEEICVSHSCLRVFGDFRTSVGEGMVFVNNASESTQVTVRTGEAARRNRAMLLRSRLKICALAHTRGH